MCDHTLTRKEINDAIQYLYDLEYEYRQSRNFWIEDIAYSCSYCNNQWLQLGELLYCPKCKKNVCLSCYYEMTKRYE